MIILFGDVCLFLCLILYYSTDQSEEIYTGAVREVKEETGVKYSRLAISARMLYFQIFLSCLHHCCNFFMMECFFSFSRSTLNLWKL